MDFPSFPNTSGLFHDSQILESPHSLNSNLRPPPDNLQAFRDQLRQPPPCSIEDFTLAELLKNQHVLTLYQSVLRASTSQMDLHREMKEMQAKVDVLQAENARLQMQQRGLHSRSVSSSASLGPSDSISQVSQGSPDPGMVQGLQPYPNPSSICPGIYKPEEICWTNADYQKNPANKRTDKNKSRPRMVDAIRHPTTKDGLSQQQWDAIRSVASQVARPLMQLSDPPKVVSARGKGRTVEWFTKNYPDEWDASIKELERREPILTYCAGNWKARAVFRVVLRGLNSGNNGSGTDTDVPSEVDASSPSTKKRRRQSSSSSRKKKKQDEGVQKPGSDAVPVDKGNKPPETPATKSLHKQISAGLSTVDPNDKAPAVPAVQVIDISFIQINHALDTLKEEFGSELLKNAVEQSQVLQLLTAFESSTPGNDAVPGKPSTLAAALLEALEDADPNAWDFEADDDDNNNGGWGHYQYTGGGRSIISSLATWEDVGSISFAQKLLAAGLRTCKVARYICEQRKRAPLGGYTSDAYLSRLVDHLWSILPVSFKPLQQGREEDDVNSGDHPLAQREDLMKWQLAELRDWISKQAIICDGKPRRSKDDCASIILSCNVASQKPTLLDIDRILKSRPKKGASSS
ncbi:hypothetical protein DFP72DRAFT_944887 [Ephemerocybe angulata]|uniref:Uncharacterized protein n=1 Tax=Ephemerocybe angulata TaxID=980116 RepID=A0A8H6LT75_9AGAR|nr:hypothetical protein DFP72DRAFT_944887 [Tulosesus angulatus]